MPIIKYSPLEKKLYKELYRKSLYEFVKGFWYETDPAKFVDGVIVQYFCEVFEYMCRSWVEYKEKNIVIPKVSEDVDVIDVRQGNKNKINMNEPPRHMKSKIFNVFGPVWLWLHYPVKVVSVSHTKDLAKKMNAQRKKIIDSPKFQALFGDEIEIVQDLTDYLINSKGGELYSQYREAMTGYGADIIINDDLTNAETAKRDMMEMANAWSYYTNTMPSRVNDIDKCLIMNIQQRLAPNDITGHILSDSKIRNSYVFVVLPAIFQRDTYIVFPISGKVVLFKKGQGLWEERFGDYKALRDGMLESVFQTQYLQNAVATEDTPIKKEMLICKSKDDCPSIEDSSIIYASHDFPVKDKETSDFLGSILAYRVGKTIYLKDCLESHMNYPKSIKYVRNIDNKYLGSIQIIEDKANGSPIIQQLQGEVPGIKAFNPGTNSKMQRLESASLYLDNVIFVEDYWDELQQKYILSPSLTNLYNRLISFPYVQHDDIIDAFTQLILFVFMDKQNSVYGRSFNADNIIKPTSELNNEYGEIFFNKEGDLWKVCKIVITYDFECNHLILVKEDKFKANIEDGIKRLKEFSGGNDFFIDCSTSDSLYDITVDDVLLEHYNVDDFEKSVVELNAAFARKLVKVYDNCTITQADIENFKYAFNKNEEKKFQTDQDGMCACLRVAMQYFGGVV